MIRNISTPLPPQRKKYLLNLCRTKISLRGKKQVTGKKRKMAGTGLEVRGKYLKGSCYAFSENTNKSLEDFLWTFVSCLWDVLWISWIFYFETFFLQTFFFYWQNFAFWYGVRSGGIRTGLGAVNEFSQRRFALRNNFFSFIR